MSISVKNITVSIGGAPSNKFNIEISGGRYTMTNFVLSQRMLDHSHLSFQLIKDPLEDISEPQFKVCSEIIGKDVTLNLQTDMMEIEIPGFGGDKVKDIEFTGFVCNASASRSSTHYTIQVEAVSWDAQLNDSPDYFTWQEKMLKDITEEILGKASPLEFESNPEFKDEPYLYCAKWSETSYGFLRRLAIRHGEWLFHDGKKLHFGKLPEQEAVMLSYPSRDIASYGIDMNTRHLNYSQSTSNTYLDETCTENAQEKMDDMLNELNEAVFNASKEKYPTHTYQEVPPGGFKWELDGNNDILKYTHKPQAKGVKAGLLTYHGTTFCSKLCIGGKLIVKDNYITDELTNAKSDVSQDEILITSISHHFGANEAYSNHFSGISANAKFPPYASAMAFPRAIPCRAWVESNDDPEGMGRVTVRFPWAVEGMKNDRDPMYTPWIRVEQPYTGKDKGFYFIPEVDEEVIIGFEGGNAEMPYVRSSVYNGRMAVDEKWDPHKKDNKNEVKAIRTANGHTIEIHDKGKGGYIKIYDNKKNNYVLTFSTDQKLIKLHSSGNIELEADNDIIMHAGHDMKIDVANRFEHSVGDTLYTNSIEGGLVTTETQNVDIAVKEHSKIYSQTKEEEAADEYYFSNRLGGFSMGQADNCFGIYASENLSIKVEDGFGVDAESYIMNASGNAFLTSDGNIEIAASEVHMN